MITVLLKNKNKDPSIEESHRVRSGRLHNTASMLSSYGVRVGHATGIAMGSPTRKLDFTLMSRVLTGVSLQRGRMD